MASENGGKCRGAKIFASTVQKTEKNHVFKVEEVICPALYMLVRFDKILFNKTCKIWQKKHAFLRLLEY